MKNYESTNASIFSNSEINFESLDIVSDIDSDVCSKDDINEVFNSPCSMVAQQAVSLNKNYILHMTSCKNDESLIGIGLSNKSCEVYRVEETSLTKIATLNEHLDAISDVRFSSSDSNICYSSSMDGTIKMWDLRTSKSCQEFKENSDGDSNLKPIISFDVSPNDKLLSAGTELYKGDAFLLFWDIRKSTLLGGYWESHTDDITQVRFHKSNPNQLASGSTDGLINVYNLQETSEDNALQDTHNTELSVDRINWYSFEGKLDAVNCLTHTGELQLWKINENDAYVKLDRTNISTALRRKSLEDSYVANVHEYNSNGDLLVVAGSNSNRGECLRTLKIVSDSLHPMSELIGNKQIVRASCYIEQAGLLITGGESGILNIWKPGQVTTISPNNQLKSDSKCKQILHHNKPY